MSADFADAQGAPVGATLNARQSALREAGARLRDTLRFRTLVRYLVSSSLRTESARTVFGYLWWLLDPLFLLAAYVVLVDVILKRGGENFPLLVLTALIAWKYFSSGTRSAISGTISKERLMRQVAFPKAVLPLAAVMAEAMHFAFGLVVLVLVGIPFGVYPHPVAAIALLIGGVQFVFTLGCALLLSSLNVFFRDIQFLTTHAFRVWFYLSPGLYPLSAVPDQFREVYLLNPFATFFSTYDAVLVDHVLPDFGALAVLAAASLGVLVIGFGTFIRLEPSFTKVS